MKKCIVIYNPISGKKIKYDFMPEFKKTLENYLNNMYDLQFSNQFQNVNR